MDDSSSFYIQIYVVKMASISRLDLVLRLLQGYKFFILPPRPPSNIMVLEIMVIYEWEKGKFLR